jgi:hypothetical protein
VGGQLYLLGRGRDDLVNRLRGPTDEPADLA